MHQFGRCPDYRPQFSNPLRVAPFSRARCAAVQEFPGGQRKPPSPKPHSTSHRGLHNVRLIWTPHRILNLVSSLLFKMLAAHSLRVPQKVGKRRLKLVPCDDSVWCTQAANGPCCAWFSPKSLFVKVYFAVAGFLESIAEPDSQTIRISSALTFPAEMRCSTRMGLIFVCFSRIKWIGLSCRKQKWTIHSTMGINMWALNTVYDRAYCWNAAIFKVCSFGRNYLLASAIRDPKNHYAVYFITILCSRYLFVPSATPQRRWNT